MNTSRKPSLSEQTSAFVSLVIQSGAKDAPSELNWVPAARPGENDDAARRRVIKFHDEAISRSLDPGSTAAWPNWLRVVEMTSLGKVDSVSAAMDLFYKSERLNRPGGIRETLIRSRQRELVAEGWLVLASRHDSTNGHALYLRKEAGALAVYMSSV